MCAQSGRSRVPTMALEISFTAELTSELKPSLEKKDGEKKRQFATNCSGSSRLAAMVPEKVTCYGARDGAHHRGFACERKKKRVCVRGDLQTEP